MNSKLKNVLNYVMIGAGILMPQLGVTMLASYAAKNAGEKIGDSMYYSKVKKAGKDELSAKSVRMDDLLNVYLNPSEYDSYFNDNSNESCAYVNENVNGKVNRKAKNVIRLGEDDGLMNLIFDLDECKNKLERQYPLNDEVIKKAVKAYDLKDTKKICEGNNLSTILKNHYESGMDDKDYNKKKYYFEGDKLKFFNHPMAENYSSSDKISIVKPENILFRTIPSDDAGLRKIKDLMENYDNVIVKGDNNIPEIVEREGLKNGRKVLIPSNLILAMRHEEKKSRKIAGMAPAPQGAPAPASNSAVTANSASASPAITVQPSQPLTATAQ